MAEADNWQPGTPLKYSLDEHVAGLKLALDDIERDVRKMYLHFFLWITTWILLIGLVAYSIYRLRT